MQNLNEKQRKALAKFRDLMNEYSFEIRSGNSILFLDDDKWIDFDFNQDIDPESLDELIATK